MLGIGGGWIQTPMMILWFGLPPLIVAGTSLLIIAVRVLSSGITHIIEGNIDWLVFIPMVSGLLAGALVGTWLKSKIKGKYLPVIIGGSLMLVVIFILVSFFLKSP